MEWDRHFSDSEAGQESWGVSPDLDFKTYCSCINLNSLFFYQFDISSKETDWRYCQRNDTNTTHIQCTTRRNIYNGTSLVRSALKVYQIHFGV